MPPRMRRRLVSCLALLMYARSRERALVERPYLRCCKTCARDAIYQYGVHNRASCAHTGRHFRHAVHNRVTCARTGRDYKHAIVKPQIANTAETASMHTGHDLAHGARNRAPCARAGRDSQHGEWGVRRTRARHIYWMPASAGPHNLPRTRRKTVSRFALLMYARSRERAHGVRPYRQRCAHINTVPRPGVHRAPAAEGGIPKPPHSSLFGCYHTGAPNRLWISERMTLLCESTVTGSSARNLRPSACRTNSAT